jgi:hypothetical protein
MKVFPPGKAATGIAAFLLGMPALLAADTPSTPLPPPASVKVDFDRDIRPILETSCLRCHGPQKPRSHFRLDDRTAALAGGDDNTNDIVPGNSEKSRLIAYVARQVPDLEMPPAGRGDALTPLQIGLLRAWIDQGATWHTTNTPPLLNLTMEPTLRWFDVSGNKQKFSELEGTKPGFSGGVENFSATEHVNPNETVSLEGHVIVPDQDFDLKVNVDRTDLGFVHAGFDQWRQYYATDGGYDPLALPPNFNFNNNLYVDNGHAWVDFGLALPHWPLIVLGYEYQYQTGTESTLDWGTVPAANGGKNIYPATQALDEHTHIITLDISKTLDGWDLENKAQVEFYHEQNAGMEASFLAGGTTPDYGVLTQDNYHQTQGMDTLTVEKQLRDWWLLDGGFYYSQLSGSDFFNYAAVDPTLGFGTTLSSQQIILNRRSEIFSFANLFRPLDYLTMSLGTQNEWTHEDGFGESIPDLDLANTVPAGSDLDEFKASQNANFRFTKIPFSVIFGDAQFSEDDYSIGQSQDVANTDQLQRQTAADNLRYDLKTGFSTSPWYWSDLTMQYERQSSDTHYNQLQDIYFGQPGPSNGYPAFILGRTVTSDQFETKLALQPARWLKTTLTWQLSSTDYSSKTDPAFDPSLGTVSDGGFIADGHYDLQTYGINATVTPFRRLYFSGAFTFSHSRVTTADNGDPSIVPYEGNIYTVNATATYTLNEKTRLQLAYIFSDANYAENNAEAGIPAGLDYTRQDVVIGLSRQLTKNMSAALHYEFSQYSEPSSGNVNNFTAHGIMASLVFRWP